MLADTGSVFQTRFNSDEGSRIGLNECCAAGLAVTVVAEQQTCRKQEESGCGGVRTRVKSY